MSNLPRILKIKIRYLKIRKRYSKKWALGGIFCLFFRQMRWLEIYLKIKIRNNRQKICRCRGYKTAQN